MSSSEDGTPRGVDVARAEKAVAEFLEALGLDVKDHPELAQTHELVVRAFQKDFLAGYAQNPSVILGETLATSSGGLVVISEIPTSTMCPHHLMPAFGNACVGYVPREKEVGFGALVRLVHCFSNRLTLQEQLTKQIVQALDEHLQTRGAACVVDMTHTCMVCRGDRPMGAHVVTRAWSGDMETDAALREEFLGYVTSPPIKG